MPGGTGALAAARRGQAQRFAAQVEDGDRGRGGEQEGAGGVLVHGHCRASANFSLAWSQSR